MRTEARKSSDDSGRGNSAPKVVPDQAFHLRKVEAECMRSLREPSWAVSHWAYRRAPWAEVTWAEVESREKVLGRVHIGPGEQASDRPPPPAQLSGCLPGPAKPAPSQTL